MTATPTTPVLDEAAEIVRKNAAIALRGVFIAADADRRRPPHGLSMSMLGGCTRRAAYALAGTPTTDVPPPDPAWAATLGTWIDEHLLPRLAAYHGGEHHQKVVLRAGGLEIPGELDLCYDDVVSDLKTVLEQRLYGVRRYGVYANHRIQVIGYAVARAQAGHTVRWVTWLYLDRDNGDHEVVTEALTNAAMMEVFARVTEIRAAAQDPDQARRDGRGPGLSRMCDGCPWLRQCWGEDAQPDTIGGQRSLAQGGAPAVAGLLEKLTDASRRRAAADGEYEFYRAAIDGLDPAEYGPWTLTWGRPGSRVNAAAAAARLEALGEPVPMSPVAPKATARLTVNLSKAQRRRLGLADDPEG